MNIELKNLDYLKQRLYDEQDRADELALQLATEHQAERDSGRIHAWSTTARDLRNTLGTIKSLKRLIGQLAN